MTPEQEKAWERLVNAVKVRDPHYAELRLEMEDHYAILAAADELKRMREWGANQDRALLAAYERAEKAEAALAKLDSL